MLQSSQIKNPNELQKSLLHRIIFPDTTWHPNSIGLNFPENDNVDNSIELDKTLCCEKVTRTFLLPTQCHGPNPDVALRQFSIVREQ